MRHPIHPGRTAHGPAIADGERRRMIDLIESLESRTLFGVDPTFTLTAKGTLVAQGTGGKDKITITLLHNKAKDGFIATLKNNTGTHEQRFLFKAVKRIYVDAGGKNDSVFIGGSTEQTRPSTVLGGAGNDTINYLCTGAIFASGGSGDDVVGLTAIVNVTSQRNRDVINGLFAVENKTAVNTLQGDAGNDTLSG